MIIRSFQKKDTLPTAKLIKETFLTFNGQDYYDREAVNEYAETFDSETHSEEELYQLFLESPLFFVAEEGDSIVGMIRGREGKISNLFVNANSHHRGIGRQLVERFEEAVQVLGCTAIEINSTLHAAPFYEKMGFTKTSKVHNFMGLKAYSMRKEFK